MSTRFLRRLGGGLSIVSVASAGYAGSMAHPAMAQQKPADESNPSLATGARPRARGAPRSSAPRASAALRSAADARHRPRARALRCRAPPPLATRLARAAIYEQEVTLSSAQLGALTGWLKERCADALKQPGFLGTKLCARRPRGQARMPAAVLRCCRAAGLRAFARVASQCLRPWLGWARPPGSGRKSLSRATS